MVLFKDIAKGSVELLTNDFPHDKPWHIETKHKSAEAKAEFNNTCACSRSGGIKATSVMKYNHDCGIKSELKVTGDGASMFDLSYGANKYVDGLTVGTKFEKRGVDKSIGESLNMYIDYGVNKRFHCKTFFNPMAATFNSSATISCNKPNSVILGGEVNGGLDVTTMKFGVGASYTQQVKQNSWVVSLRSNGTVQKGVQEVACNVHAISAQGISKGPSELAVEMRQFINEGKTDISFGGLWYFDHQKESSVKAKIAHDAMLTLALSHVFSPSLTGILGIQMDTTKVSSVDSMKYGIKIMSTT